MPETLASRSFDVARLNALANDPAVRPFVGGDGASAIDLTDAVADRQNYFVAGEHGAFSFCWTAPDVYEVHTFVLPSGRGAWAVEFASDARAYMAAQGTIMLWTRVPVGADNVRHYAERAGFRPVGEQAFAGVDYLLYAWRP